MKNIILFIIIIIILLTSLIGYAMWIFNRQISREINNILSQVETDNKEVIREDMLDKLPLPVQKWLKNCGIIGKEKIQTMYLKQTGFMKLKPDQTEWTKAEAEQYIVTDKPAFLWKVKMKMMPLINVFGRDLFQDGHGQMQIKIASLIPVVSISNNEKANQSTLQRYLLELPWYPSAAISPYITWEGIDDYTAKATMSYQGVTGSATYYFNEQGDFIKCSAQRYKDTDENAKLLECIGQVTGYDVVDGIKIPNQLDISWVLDDEIFTWYKLKIYDIRYN